MKPIEIEPRLDFLQKTIIINKSMHKQANRLFLSYRLHAHMRESRIVNAFGGAYVIINHQKPARQRE